MIRWLSIVEQDTIDNFATDHTCLSILKNGLVVDAPYAEVTGKAYGSGIYLSDAFAKSVNYSEGAPSSPQGIAFATSGPRAIAVPARPHRRGRRQNNEMTGEALGSKYVLLCEAALGQV